MIRKFLLCILGCVVLSALPSGSIPASAATKAVPRFEKSTCKFEVPKGLVIQCGNLVVLENRAKPKGNTITLAVAVVKAQGQPKKSDPIVYLEGGPGGHAVDRIPLELAGFAPYMVNRDFVFFDQRGAGLSQPALDCPEVTKAQYELETGSYSTITAAAVSAASLQECRNRLVGQGVVLADYNTQANAADLNDLRIALGYKTWNLYGISYGTRLALVTMRSFPTGIRSVILDSTFPFGGSVYGPEQQRNAVRAFQTLFQRCADDVLCNTSFPNLAQAYSDLTKQLNDHPATVTVTQPATGKQYTLHIDGATFYQSLYIGLYSTNILPVLPEAIYQAYEGNFKLIGRLALLKLSVDETVSEGMYYSVMCADKQLPFVLCGYWGVKPSNADTSPVRSSLPTLVLAGEFDPITPPRYGRQAADTLVNSYFFQFPGYGHGVSVLGDCSRKVMLAFLDNPGRAPDGSCVSKLPEPDFLNAYF